MGDGPTLLATTREEMDVKEEGVDVVIADNSISSDGKRPAGPAAAD